MMNSTNYKQHLNLNYLRVFEAIYSQRSAQGAAQTLGISQSAVSQTLNKLREFTGDPLFHVVKGIFEPTPRATLIGEGLKQQLDALDNRVASAPLANPEQFEGNIRIAVCGLIFDALMDEITHLNILNALPRANITFTYWNKFTPQEIEEGKVDLGLNYSNIPVSKAIRVVNVSESTPVIIARRYHPWKMSQLTEATFTDYDLAGMVIADDALSRKDIKSNFLQGIEFRYRSASMALLHPIAKTTDTLILTEKLTASKIPQELEMLQPKWLPGYLPVINHAVFYLNKHHNHPIYQYIINTIRELITSKLT